MFRDIFIFLCCEHLSTAESRSSCIVLQAPVLYWRHEEEPSLQPDGSLNPRPCTSLAPLICAVTCRLSPRPRVIVGASLAVANPRLYLGIAHVVLCLRCISVGNSLPHCPYLYHRRDNQSLTLECGSARRKVFAPSDPAPLFGVRARPPACLAIDTRQP